ncbi:NAD(P)/FAD-dependent oxidoreductase [Thioclava kandeliae]|uniref:FAD-dependent oxidoreductase n=1 Tax=Thioclava kandeliae TaxID=3070818 RepID=A0ABV1SJY4_9RHOB
MSPTAIVLGAGMVGTATALALQARGWEVTLIDRRPAGQETSFGNAGIIEAEAAEPFAMPRDPASLWAIATGRNNEVAWDLRGVLAQAPALWRYFRASAPARHLALSRHYAALTRRATSDHAPLIAAAGADPLIRRDGFYMVMRDPRALETAWTEAQRLRESYGVASEILDSTALRAAEPVSARAAGAILWPEAWSCRDPGALVSAYAALFTARGGRMMHADATQLQRKGSGWELGGAEAQHVVLALGPFSNALLAPLIGLSLPMVLKRGYHCHMEGAALPSRPVLDADYGVVAAPMVRGLRLLTGADLCAHPARAPRQLARGEAALRQLLDLGQRSTDPVWTGQRPCMADMLPVLGPVTDQRGMWIHTGHGHQGFTLGPTTAALLADAMTEGRPLPDALLLSRARGHRWHGAR